MAESEFRSKIVALAHSVQALAAIGAALKLQRDDATAPAEVRGLLDTAIEQLGLPAPRDLDAAEIDRLVAMVNFHLRHALELFTKPRRPPGWSHADLDLLEAQGVMSRGVISAIAAAAAARPEFAAVLDRPGAFLDIGTGVGRLAIEAGRAWPALRVVGIDIWEPALTAARCNVLDAGLEGRIEVRTQNALDLSDRAAFTLVWVPVPFFEAEALATLLPRARDALVPGGWIVCSVESLPDEPVARTLAMLRTVRGGGTIHSAEEVAQYLRAAGLAGVETVPSGPLHLALGQRPEV